MYVIFLKCVLIHIDFIIYIFISKSVLNYILYGKEEYEAHTYSKLLHRTKKNLRHHIEQP